MRDFTHLKHIREAVISLDFASIARLQIPPFYVLDIGGRDAMTKRDKLTDDKMVTISLAKLKLLAAGTNASIRPASGNDTDADGGDKPSGDGDVYTSKADVTDADEGKDADTYTADGEDPRASDSDADFGSGDPAGNDFA